MIFRYSDTLWGTHNYSCYLTPRLKNNLIDTYGVYIQKRKINVSV
jgi:hypothetical protein